jgi:hypothetical protein
MSFTEENLLDQAHYVTNGAGVAEVKDCAQATIANIRAWADLTIGKQKMNRK